MNRITENSVLDAIEACWMETFSGLPFDADVAWRDSGADSLKSTLFMLRLEERLGLAIPLDSLGPDTSARQLAELLDQRRHGFGGENSRNDMPVFLLPGMLGDEPRLATFRQAFGEPNLFEVLRLPDIERTARELSSITASAAIVREDVEHRQPDGPVCLFGYSVGGILAYEVAAQLIDRGREVALLGLLDPFLRIKASKPLRIEGAGGAAILSGSKLTAAGSAGIFSREKVAFGLPLVTGNLERARRHLANVAADIPIETLYWRRQRLIGRLRWRALRKWRPAPLDVPAILISSDEAEEHFDVDAWKRLLPQLRRVHVGGTHLGLFESEPLRTMLPVLREAIAAIR